MAKKIIKNLKQKGLLEATIIFVSFVLLLLLKNVLFHYFVYNGILVSSIFSHPYEAIIFYLPKLVAPLLLGSFIYLTKRRWWSIVVAIILDLWCIANLLFYRANDLLIDIKTIGMLDNLSGFESSIGAYFLSSYWLFPLLTILYVMIVIIIEKCLDEHATFVKGFIISLICTIGVYVYLCLPEYKEYQFVKSITGLDKNDVIGADAFKEKYGGHGIKTFIPYNAVRCCALPYSSYNPQYGYEYVKKNSILSYSGAIIVFEAFNNDNELSNVEIPKSIINHMLYSDNQLNNVIVILVESLESWVFEFDDIVPNVVPNMALVKNSQNSLYCNRIKSQAKYGGSGDGQMIVTSGLLPTKVGAACLLYGDNVWPSFVSQYDHSVFIDIANGVWNQRQMTKQYGYKTDLYDKNGRWNDEAMFIQMERVLDTIQEPFFVMALTESSHTPFEHSCSHLSARRADVPQMLKDYLECLHFTDSCFGEMWNRIKNQEKIQNATIVITGDHTVFKRAMLTELSTYAKEYNLPISNAETYCPLIIHSKQIKGQKIDTTLNCQMDIYPTILCLSGSNYYWRGLGESLLERDIANDITRKEQGGGFARNAREICI